MPRCKRGAMRTAWWASPLDLRTSVLNCLDARKSAIVRRTPTGKWYVSICCTEVEPNRLPASSEQVGIDVGLKTFAYLSTDEHIDNPRFFREEEKHLARAQRKVSKAPIKTPAKK